ncbi:hypothetical protein [Micromonospora sp. RTP1Z1]|uniref:hypothetical protein n=1 Tax=Micromonospora sp. RTP1Z1 TaxID=2994043 RepID=UPI0029C60A16|nr:hypothetical protein [Micromonospora sp. RTP1Z1]
MSVLWMWEGGDTGEDVPEASGSAVRGHFDAFEPHPLAVVPKAEVEADVDDPQPKRAAAVLVVLLA